MTYRTKLQDGNIAVPIRLQQVAGLAEGEPLHITFEERRLVIERPARRASSNRKREEFLDKLRESAPEALKRLWAESERKGLNKTTAREINSEIARHRKGKRRSLPPVSQPAR